ncbi:hypothetical protein HY632_00955 [Candidatus Uhrbacteria bacterium]|nr:hypothetical protein [Candidatus Uhrbacteria bacterium]
MPVLSYGTSRTFLNTEGSSSWVTRGRRRSFAFVRTVLVSVIVFGVIIVPTLVAAADAGSAIQGGLNFGTATGLSTQDIRITVAKIIRAFLGFLGVIAIIITLTGGFLWMTASGNEEKVVRAKRTITNGVIGIAIILMAFSIAHFVLGQLQGAIDGTGGVRSAGGFTDSVALSGALGAGPIESHYPTRGQADVPRNARIFVTFREPIDPATFVANTYQSPGDAGSLGTTGEDAQQFDNYRDLALPEAVQVAPVGVNIDPTKLTAVARESDPTGFATEAAKLVPVGVAMTADRRTIVLVPVVTEVASGALRVRTSAQTGAAERQLLGNASQSTAYVVRLTNAMKRASRRSDGTPNDLFMGAFRDGYTWDFTVSTTVDLTPPQVQSVVPFPDRGRDTAADVVGKPDQPVNVIVQVNFTEPMDPTVTTGTVTAADVGPAGAPDAQQGFRHLAVMEQGRRVPGTFTISNQYRTVEFTTDAACGENSCGGTVYCLPKNAELQAVIEAARLDAGGPSGLPFSGVMDAAGNSFDGNFDARATGPGVPRFTIKGTAAANRATSDSAQWTFFTNDRVDLTAPEILEVVHFNRADQARRVFDRAAGASLTGVDDISAVSPVEVLFSKLMSGNLASELHLEEVTAGLTGCDPATGRGCLWHTSDLTHQDTARDADDGIDATRAIVSHADLREAQSGLDVPQYRVRVGSNARDLYQNCFFTVTDTPRGPRGLRGGERCIGAAMTNCSLVP